MHILDSTRLIIFIVLAGVVLRIGAAQWLSNYPVASDAAAYRNTAIAMREGEQFTPFWPPGLPAYLTVVYSTVNQDAVTERSAMIGFYVILTLALFFLVREMVSLRAANLAALIVTFYPNYIYHSVTVLTQLPIAACLAVIVYLTYRVCKEDTMRPGLRLLISILLGVVLAYTALTRPSSLILLAFIPLYVLWQTRQLLAPLITLIVPVVILGVYLVQIYRIDNQFILINYANSYNLFLGNNPDTPLYQTWLFGTDIDARTPEFNTTLASIQSQPPQQQDTLYRDAALEHITERPDLFIVRTLNRIRAYFGFDTIAGARLINEGIAGTMVGLLVIAVDALFYMAIMVTTLFFLFSVYRKALPLQWIMLILGVAFLYSVPYFFAFSHPTYHIPIVPLLTVFSAAWLTRPVLQWKVLTRFAWIMLIVFVFIQVEWAVIMAQDFLSG